MDWVNQKIEQREREQNQEQKLHSQSHSLWNTVWDVARITVDDLNALQLPQLGGIPITISSRDNEWRHIRLIKSAYPAYYIDAILDWEKHVINIKWERVEPGIPDPRITYERLQCPVRLGQDGNATIVNQSTEITPDQFLQLLLSPAL